MKYAPNLAIRSEYFTQLRFNSTWNSHILHIESHINHWTRIKPKVLSIWLNNRSTSVRNEKE
jgi:hypothetical protein